MCAPLAITGLQVASSLAQGAADAKSLKRQARIAQQEAQAVAAAHTAQASFARDRAGHDSAADRVRSSTSAVDPASESLVSSLADRHARRLDTVLQEEDAARASLAEGASRAATLRRSSRNAVYRSLLGNAVSLINRTPTGNQIAIPL